MSIAQKLFDAMMAHSVAESEATDALIAAIGVDPRNPDTLPCGNVAFDDYDGSFEFKATKDDWSPDEAILAKWWALGFDRCWICYCDGTERYYTKEGHAGERLQRRTM